VTVQRDYKSGKQEHKADSDKVIHGNPVFPGNGVASGVVQRRAMTNSYSPSQSQTWRGCGCSLRCGDEFACWRFSHRSAIPSVVVTAVELGLFRAVAQGDTDANREDATKRWLVRQYQSQSKLHE
jgi:hypothetical protein